MQNQEQSSGPWPSAPRAWWGGTVLMLANTLAFVDRQALALMVQPIKQDLGLSDTAISLLYGLSFTLFYVAVGLPVARLADRTNRRNLVAGAILVWSMATSLCGLARSFAVLLAARVGVGAGEGGLTPSALSLLADYFPKERLPLAISMYQIGIYLGNALALVIGGVVFTHIHPSASVVLPLVGAMKGWQLVFLLLGLPGMVLAALALSIPEPVRQGPGAGAPRAPLSQFFAHIDARRRAYVGIMLGFALMILVGNGTAVWIPAFFERTHGWTTAGVGRILGPIVFVCGAAGALTGGFVATALRRRGVAHGHLAAALFGFCMLVPITIGFPLMPNPDGALALVGAMNFFAAFNFGGGLAALQELTPNRMRALMSGAYMLMANLIGGALGPTLIALVTDYGFRDARSLNLAMSLVCALASPLAVGLLWMGMRDYRRILSGA